MFCMPEELNKHIDYFSPKCFVYFISDGEYTKIGIAKNMENRLLSLQVGNPKKLNIISFIPCSSEFYARKIEKYLHEQLNGCRVMGEWFKLPGIAFSNNYLKFTIDYKDWEKRYKNAEYRRNYKTKYCYGRRSF